MKRALVTGGSGELGAAICRVLAQDGLEVLVHANSRGDRARSVAASIEGGGGRARAIIFDVTDAEGTSRALAPVVEEGPVQIVVNNAGMHDDAVMAGMSAAQWSRVIDVSLNGFFNVTQPLLLPMIRTRWGRVVNISSVAAIMGNRGQVNYAAAKAALHGATKSLAIEVASRGVTVNAVAPGIIESPMASTAFTKEKIEALVPMKRAGRPEEVADLVSFLVSDRAAYISGQILSINGAMA